MSDSPDNSPNSSPTETVRQRYLTLIETIVNATLKGQIRSKEQVYQMLMEQVSADTGEIFEQSLSERVASTQQQIESLTDELKQAKATRSLRALQTIQGEWTRWQAQNQANTALTHVLRDLLDPQQSDRLGVLIRLTDPNRPQPLNLGQWKQLAKQLSHPETPANADTKAELHQLAEGILAGLEAWTRLEPQIVGWIYEQSQGQLGFAGVPGQRGPWAFWAKQVNPSVPQSFFQTIALGDSVTDWIRHQHHFQIRDFVELSVILRGLQQGLVTWFDQWIYDSKIGAKLSISTFLVFAVLWSQLASGFEQTVASTQRSNFVNACFQLTLQILRSFSQRDYFPLYGGIFASFSGEYLRDTLSYLDEPLRQAEGTQEKARILTLLGYSARAMGQPDRAIDFHQQALEIARSAGDAPCEIANLNHLSRTYVAQENYTEAINYSQRAVILSRQKGDRTGEANAIANLGYSEVFQARMLEQTDPETYEMAVERLQQGLELAERLGDGQSRALCYSSLGIAEVMLERWQDSIAHLEQGIQIAQFSGDVYLQGLNWAYLAEAHYHLQRVGDAVRGAGLAMYLLEQIGSDRWRQPAGLLMVLRGQLGEAEFAAVLGQQRSAIIALIGVDGFDYLPQLLERYGDPI
jgi:tetratricopeptide (TPR) repeat protein